MPSIGVIGGGQLARMMQPAAIALGIELKVFAETENSSAHLTATTIGDYTDWDQLFAFANQVDVITFDHEHVPTYLLERLVENSIPVRPGPKALIHAQNKLVMRRKLSELGLPQPAWRAASSAGEISDFLKQYGPKIIVKTPIGGYDGKGVRVVSEIEQVSDWLSNIDAFGGELLLEQKVDFKRELAQLSARRPSGEIVTWPLVATYQAEGVCSEVIAPAPEPADFEAARETALKIASGLEVVGVMAVELFETQEGAIVVNELAMRPHNSGHFSIEGSRTSQFEQHLRAVLDLPLGATDMADQYAVMFNLLGVNATNSFVENYPVAMAQFPNVKFHLYEKSPRAGRKMGHLTLTGTDLEKLIADGNSCRSLLYQQ